MSVEFSELGLITPARIVQLSTADFYHCFVGAFPDSTSRPGLYKNWVQYSNELRNLLGVGFTQWVNGSFVTRKLNPNDLDLVSFLPHDFFHRYEEELEEFWSFSRKDEGLDAYLLPVYPRHHLRYRQVARYRREWQGRFRRTREFSEKKGFIRLTIR